MTDASLKINGDRGSGRTAQQMQAAPFQAVFVWCNGSLLYPRDLARHLGRPDLKIVSPAWVGPSQMTGCTSPISVDHAANLSLEQRGAISAIKRRADDR